MRHRVTIRSRKSVIVDALKHYSDLGWKKMDVTCSVCGATVKDAEVFVTGVVINDRDELCESFIISSASKCDCRDKMLAGTRGIVAIFDGGENEN